MDGVWEEPCALAPVSEWAKAAPLQRADDQCIHFAMCKQVGRALMATDNDGGG